MTATISTNTQPPVTVVLDAEPLLFPCSGIGIYTRQLLRALVREMGPDGWRLSYASIRNERLRTLESVVRTEFPGVHLHTFRLPGVATRLLDRRLGAWTTPAIPGPALYHATSFMRPPWGVSFGLPQVLTIHDLAFLRETGELFGPPAYTAMLRKKLPEAARRAAMILTVSEFTKRETVSLLGIPEEKIAVTPLATQWDGEMPAEPAEQNSRLLHDHGLVPGTYFLGVGQLSPRKNFTTLLQAFAAFRQRQPDARLVLVGRPGWDAQELVGRLEAGIPGVTWFRECAGDELCMLYRRARAFFLVSWYEGFGIPLLEAMQCGCPTCYATGSSLDEVAGDAGLPVRPDDTAGIAEAMSGLWNNQALAESLREKGLRRAAGFSWHRTATTTVEAYRRALGHENRH
jgi:glycosyltransferase involved in cell wall biosynthesis